MRFSGIRTVALSLALGLGSLHGALAADVKWDMANEYPPNNIHSEADQFFAKRLDELSGGSIKIVHQFGAALGYRSKDQFDAVGDGAIPIADTFSGALSGINPLFLLSSLPFLTATADDSRALHEAAKTDYEKAFADSNQILLFVSPWPPSGLWGKTPLDSKASLSGLKMRTYDANGTITFKAAGASPVQLSFADVVPQLSAGGIDAVLNSAEGGVSSKYWEYLSDFTELNYCMPLNFIHLNKDVFDDLSDDQKAAVMKAAEETQAHIWEAVVERRAKNYETMRANKIAITDKISTDYADFLKEAGNVARQKWLDAMGARGKEIMDTYLAKN